MSSILGNWQHILTFIARNLEFCRTLFCIQEIFEALSLLGPSILYLI
uniref:Uncharacterized protein n=1 Tax=Rhizophora mucronata TaxID=61149 RepID=A0A2P2IIE0_RHIMU